MFTLFRPGTPKRADFLFYTDTHNPNDIDNFIKQQVQLNLDDYFAEASESESKEDGDMMIDATHESKDNSDEKSGLTDSHPHKAGIEDNYLTTKTATAPANPDTLLAVDIRAGSSKEEEDANDPVEKGAAAVHAMTVGKTSVLTSEFTPTTKSSRLRPANGMTDETVTREEEPQTEGSKSADKIAVEEMVNNHAEHGDGEFDPEPEF